MGAHLVDGEFQSDKYPECPRGKVPLSTKDPAAQDLLWVYAERRRAGSHGSREVDEEFAEDVQEALRLKGFEGGSVWGERARIVAWLRRFVGPTAEPMRDIADAIEKGAHMPPTTTGSAG